MKTKMNEDFSLIKQEQNMEKREVEYQLKELVRKYQYNKNERIRLEDIVVDLTEDIKTLLHGGNTYQLIQSLVKQLTDRLGDMEIHCADNDSQITALRGFMAYLKDWKPSTEKKIYKKKKKAADE